MGFISSFILAIVWWANFQSYDEKLWNALEAKLT